MIARGIPVVAMLCVVSLGAFSLGGCAHVEAWERGSLAKPQMRAPVNPQQRIALDHIFDSREAASGGAATSGGGCGCY